MSKQDQEEKRQFKEWRFQQIEAAKPERFYGLNPAEQVILLRQIEAVVDAQIKQREMELQALARDKEIKEAVERAIKKEGK